MHLHNGDRAHDHPAAGGGVIRWARRYDLLVPAVLAGRGRALRTRIGRIVQLQEGQRVLDIGCGTGTLTLAMARIVGPTGAAIGVDAAAEMVAAALRKAGRRSLPPTFYVASAQHLPFEDAVFDVAVMTLALHHLPPGDRPQAISEMLRVLRPGGHLLIVEFRAPAHRIGRALVTRTFGHAMVDTDLTSVMTLVSGAGAHEVQQSPTPVPWLGAVHARSPTPSG